MSTIRDFIRSLGDQAPDFFQVKPDHVARWLKHGNMPLNKVDMAFAIMTRDLVNQTRTIDIANSIPAYTYHEPDRPDPSDEVKPLPVLVDAPELEVDPAVMEEQDIPPEALPAVPRPIPQTVSQASMEQAKREGLIEINPYEQNAGSFVHPGRIAVPAQRAAPRIMQKRQSVSPQAQKVERDNTPKNVPVYTREQYEAAMKKVKPHGATNWAAPRPPSDKKDASKLAQRRGV